jgi:hypothetical protein
MFVKQCRFFVVLGLCLACCSAPLQAASLTWLNLLNYQGRLTDAAGNAVSDGTYNITFNLYSVPSGGTSLWTEAQSVTVNKGLFNAVLGSVNSLGSLAGGNFTTDLWLGVTVAGDTEMAPRQQLLPAVYARNAQALQGLLPNNAPNNLVVLDSAGKVPAGLVKGASLSVPLDLNGSSATYDLSVSNTSASPSALALNLSGPNGALAQATDPAGTALWGQSSPSDGASAAGVAGAANNGIGVLAQSVSGVGLSATSQSASNPALFAAGAFPARFVASSAGTSNAAVQASTQAGDQSVNLADRGNKAGLFASVSAVSAYGVSATASSGTGVFGQTGSSNPADSGVTGLNNALGAGFGVQGQGFIGVEGAAIQNNGRGVEGDVPATVTGAFGVLGVNNSATGIGVVGRHLGSGAGIGVRGGSSAGVGAMGVYGTVTGAAAIGVEGFGSASDAFGVIGIQGNAFPGTGASGVYGKTNNLSVGVGVRGEGSQGVYGLSNNQCGVCAYNTNTGGGYGLYANSPGEAILAESTATSGLAYGVYGSTQSEANSSAAGYFAAQGAAGATYGVVASNASSAGYGVYAVGGQHALHGAAGAGGVNVFSDPLNAPSFGFYHSDPGPPSQGVGVYAAENCGDCFGGDFINTAATTGTGAALNVQGRIRVLSSAGTFVAPNGATTFTLNNNYITANCLIFLTVASSTGSVAAVASKSAGSAQIAFTPALAANTTYQFLIIGQ